MYNFGDYLSMDNKSTEFEKITAEIFNALRTNPNYEKVEHNVILSGKDGPRQIDVLISAKVNNLDIRIIVECKDYNKNIGPGLIGELYSKMDDVRAHKAVLVTRKGFSKQSINKAKRLGITICTVHQAKSDKWAIPIDIPIIIEEITPILEISFLFRLSKECKINTNEFLIINDTNLYNLFENDWNKNLLNYGNENDLYDWNTDFIKEPYYIYNTNRDKINIYDLNMKYKINKKHYFGFVNNLDSAKMINYISEGRISLIYKNDDIINYKDKFILLNNLDELPIKNSFKITYIAKPIISFGHLNTNVERIR